MADRHFRDTRKLIIDLPSYAIKKEVNLPAEIVFIALKDKNEKTYITKLAQVPVRFNNLKNKIR